MTTSASSIIQQSGLYGTLRPIFQKINNGNWDQETGYVHMQDLREDNELVPGFKCCVGAHIAVRLNILCSPQHDIYAFDDGEFYILDKLNEICEISEYMMYALFHCAGAPENPFSHIKWDKHPTEVLENMMYIETLPPIPQDDITNIDQYYKSPDVIEWLELERWRIVYETGSKIKD